MTSLDDQSAPGPFARQWLRWTLLLWLAAAVALIVVKWGAIHAFQLNDTDDNLRMAEVTSWLNGQGWFDLRQYRLDPPLGANIHWSRLVDLPIAGITLALRPFAGSLAALKTAAGLAPLIPLALAMGAMALAARRLIAPGAFVLGALLTLCGSSSLYMWMPMRVDHHGWQLAFLAMAVAGAVDPARRRGGIVAGLATALSLVIGLEMLPYLAIAGGLIALRWVADGEERARMAAYAATLAAGSGIGWLLFASTVNRPPVCDALSPVWLFVTIGGGGLLLALSFLRRGGWPLRLVLAALAGAALAGMFAYSWPHCLARPEGISPELDRLWLSHVREAKPAYSHGWRVWLPLVSLPLIGLAGSLTMLWRTRRTPAFAAWVVPAVMGLTPILMLTWQTRAGPAAQLLAVPGAAALGWLIFARVAQARRVSLRMGLGVAAFLIVSGAAVPMVVGAFPAPKVSAGRKAVARANRTCPMLGTLRPVARMPAATILTFVDFGPRLIAVTHHSAIAGPYHRNGAAILDVQHAFRGSPDEAREIMRRHGATMVLICPNMSESTIYASEAKDGFYVRLIKGRAPDWLEPVTLPKGSPLRLWRVRG